MEYAVPVPNLQIRDHHDHVVCVCAAIACEGLAMGARFGYEGVAEVFRVISRRIGLG